MVPTSSPGCATPWLEPERPQSRSQPPRRPSGQRRRKASWGLHVVSATAVLEHPVSLLARASPLDPTKPGSSEPGAASCCCTSAIPPRARETAAKRTKCIHGEIDIQAFRQRFRCSARSRHSHSLNSVRLLSSLRHACMAFSHARFVRDSSHGEGGSRARNSARRPVSSVSKYARKELVSSMSFQAWYSLDRQIASTPAARCITRRSQSIASVISSSHTRDAAAR